jgi:hypothetical protein
MKTTKQTKKALQMIQSSYNITGIKSDQEPLDIDYVNKNPEEDDIVIMGSNCTIFLDELDDCIIVGNEIKIKDYCTLHIK